MVVTTEIERLGQTRDAFDSVAADYDGPRGNNDLIQEMRRETWRWLDAVFERPARLLELGCGTGIDAVRMARSGHWITATDWSALMVQRTADRAQRCGVGNKVRALTVGSHELDTLEDGARYDGAYSNLGPLNCVPDLRTVSRECARLLRPGGHLVFTVIGRLCPWELVHYVLRLRWTRAAVRFAPGVVPVGMNRQTIWTRYYSPAQFYRGFEDEFTLTHLRGLCVFAPPPYLATLRERYPRVHRWLWSTDRRLAGLPLLRQLGDHFLIIMRKRQTALSS